MRIEGMPVRMPALFAWKWDDQHLSVVLQRRVHGCSFCGQVKSAAKTASHWVALTVDSTLPLCCMCSCVVVAKLQILCKKHWQVSPWVLISARFHLKSVRSNLIKANMLSRASESAWSELPVRACCGPTTPVLGACIYGCVSVFTRSLNIPWLCCGAATANFECPCQRRRSCWSFHRSG